MGDSGFSCLTLTGGGEAATGDTTGSGNPWELLLLFTGSNFGTAGVSTGSDVPWELRLLFSTGKSFGTAEGTPGSDMLVGEVAPEDKKQ